MAANKCVWAQRRAESLLSREKKRQTTHTYGFALLEKERLTSCAESRYTKQGLISTRQGAMSAEECADEHADERASSNSPDVLEAIKRLPPELHVKICKEYVSTKQREREALGWKRVHEEMAIMRKVWEREALGWDELREELVAIWPTVEPSCNSCELAVCECPLWICPSCQYIGCPCEDECGCDCLCSDCFCDKCPCGGCPCGTCAECPCADCTCGVIPCHNKKTKKGKLVGMCYRQAREPHSPH